MLVWGPIQTRSRPAREKLLRRNSRPLGLLWRMRKRFPLHSGNKTVKCQSKSAIPHSLHSPQPARSWCMPLNIHAAYKHPRIILDLFTCPAWSCSWPWRWWWAPGGWRLITTPLVEAGNWSPVSVSSPSSVPPSSVLITAIGDWSGSGRILLPPQRPGPGLAPHSKSDTGPLTVNLLQLTRWAVQPEQDENQIWLCLIYLNK